MFPSGQSSTASAIRSKYPSIPGLRDVRASGAAVALTPGKREGEACDEARRSFQGRASKDRGRARCARKTAARIEAGDAPNAQTAQTVGVLIDTEEAAYDDSEVSDDEPVLSVCVAEHEAARVLLRRLKAALDARERGDIAAGRLFAHDARDYVTLRRGAEARRPAVREGPGAGQKA